MSKQLLEEFKTISEEILYPKTPEIVKIDQADTIELINRSKSNTRRRMRICAHPNAEDQLHEMIIVHEKGTYVRPHKHIGRPESFHVVTGVADIFVFQEDGGIREIIPMGDYQTKRNYYYRVAENLYHTLYIHSDYFVFHETSMGPFAPQTTVFAPWSPDPKNTADAEIFMEKLRDAAKAA